MKRVEVSIPCGDITLEGVWQFPEHSGKFSAVIFCHPHPLHGGNLHNHVVSTVSRMLLERSIAALRFNFRGVGRSGGTFGEGIGEQDDLRAAIDFVLAQKNVDADRLGLAGYSFGGRVVVPVAVGDKRIKAVLLVSPALDETAWNLLRQYRAPKMLVSGGRDEFFPFEQFEAEFKSVPVPKQLHVVSGADHFWQDYEIEAGEKAGKFFEENL